VGDTCQRENICSVGTAALGCPVERSSTRSHKSSAKGRSDGHNQGVNASQSRSKRGDPSRTFVIPNRAPSPVRNLLFLSSLLSCRAKRNRPKDDPAQSKHPYPQQRRMCPQDLPATPKPFPQLSLPQCSP